MKKLLVVVLLFITIKCLAPEYRAFPVFKEEPVTELDRFIYAINMVEARIDDIRFDTLAFNDLTAATGAFQITQIRLDDYNKRTGNNYRLKDCFDYGLSKKIFLYYLFPDNYELTARLWYGIDEHTDEYWKAVRSWY